MAHRMVSPNQMLDEAKTTMLEGRDPTTTEDWERIMNYMAYHVEDGVAEAACLLLAKIYDMPLTDDVVKQIVAFQITHG